MDRLLLFPFEVIFEGDVGPTFKVGSDGSSFFTVAPADDRLKFGKEGERGLSIDPLSHDDMPPKVTTVPSHGTGINMR
jgi:hypothetical protein